MGGEVDLVGVILVVGMIMSCSLSRRKTVN